MVELNRAFQALLANQLEMNPRTWAALQARGIDETTLLVVDFMFTAKGKPEAKALERFLREHTTFRAIARAERGTRLRRRWIVRGRTQPSTTSPAMLDDWVTFMVKAGYRHACRFDGWGVEVPPPPSVEIGGAAAGPTAVAPRPNGSVRAMAAERRERPRRDDDDDDRP